MFDEDSRENASPRDDGSPSKTIYDNGPGASASDVAVPETTSERASERERESEGEDARVAVAPDPPEEGDAEADPSEKLNVAAASEDANVAEETNERKTVDLGECADGTLATDPIEDGAEELAAGDNADVADAARERKPVGTSENANVAPVADQTTEGPEAVVTSENADASDVPEESEALDPSGNANVTSATACKSSPRPRPKQSAFQEDTNENDDPVRGSKVLSSEGRKGSEPRRPPFSSRANAEPPAEPPAATKKKISETERAATVEKILRADRSGEGSHYRVKARS